MFLCLPLCLFALIGCKDIGHFDDGTGGPGGGDPGSQNFDASGPLLDGGLVDDTITGQLCLTTDLASRDCAPLTGSQLSVQAGGAAVTVDDDGRFRIATPSAGAKIVIYVAPNATYFGGTAVAVVDQNRAAFVEIPIVTRNTLDDIVLGSTSGQLAGNGVGVIQVSTSNDAPLSAANAESLGATLPYYDTSDPNVYTLGGQTSTRGTVVYFNLPPQPSGYAATVTPVTGSPGQVEIVSLVDALHVVPLQL